MVKARKNSKPVLYSKLDVSKVEFTQMDMKSEEAKKRMQFTSWIRYGDNNLVFQTPEIQITSHGIPPKEGKDGKEWFKDEKDRSYIKLPLDETQDRVSKFKEMLMKFDKHAEKNLKNIFGSEKVAGHYLYNGVVKTPQSNDELIDDDDEKEAKPLKPDYIKIKLDLNWDTGKCTTPVFVKNEAGKPEKVAVDCISDLEKFFGYKSKVICVVMVNKVWAGKTKDQGSGKRPCGITFKLKQISIDNSDRQSSGARQDFTEYAIINENGNDNEDEDENEVEDEVDEVEEDEEEAEDDEEAEDNDEAEDDEEEEDEEDEVDEEEEEELDEEEEEVVEKKKPKSSKSGKKSGKSRSK